MSAVDKRIIDLIKNSVFVRHRSMFFILGENSRHHVVVLYHLLFKQRKFFQMEKPVPLWCFKKELGFNLYHHKKMKKLQKKYTEAYVVSKENMFEHFLLTSQLQVCHYNDTDKILGQTFGLLILQDFSALTPNILARLVECVEGGGMIIFLFPNLQSLEEIFSLHMEAHSRYITEAQSKVLPLFNKRFVLSLLSCEDCLVLDNSLKIKLLPEKSLKFNQNFHLSSAPINKIECCDVQNNVFFTTIFSLCRTSDQSFAMKRLFEVFKKKDIFTVVSLTSARGRGKSALLGLIICSTLQMHMSNIIVTSPCLENVQVLFAFLIKGLQALGLMEDKHFKVSHTGSSQFSFTTGVQIFQEHRLTVSYVSPVDFLKLGNPDLVVIDEAAAIPSSVVKKWIGPYNVCMASTINGYEGTGRSLSLKLINQLRNQSSSDLSKIKKHSLTEKIAHDLEEITLHEAIRYSEGDRVEKWLNSLLCLDASTESLIGFALPKPEECQLYYVNKKALFCHNKQAELFLQQIVALFVTSHYKNSPNDLLMMADAPSHHLFCLLPPSCEDAKGLPHILCVIQVALEGKISAENYNHEQSHGRRASGDLIPWIISQQFQEEAFTTLAGARVVRIATQPDCQSMGYGQHCLQLLCQNNESSVMNHQKSDDISKKENLDCSTAPLLLKLSKSPINNLDYIGVSYGLTAQLLKFWKRSGFVPLYIRQTTSDITGEHSCVMVKALKESTSCEWLIKFYSDFTSRFVSLLPSAFSSFDGSLALSILHSKSMRPINGISAAELRWFMGPPSLIRLEAYCNNLIDHHLVLDLLPGVSKLYFSGFLNDYFLNSVQEIILLCMGLQNKSVEVTSNELNMEVQQVMGCFRKALKRILGHLRNIFLIKENEDVDSTKRKQDDNCSNGNKSGSEIHVRKKKKRKSTTVEE